MSSSTGTGADQKTTIPHILAETFLPTIFSDHMVIQRNKPFNVFGKDRPGQKVTAVLAGQEASSVAGPDGKWRITFTPPAAGGPYQLTIAGSTRRIYSDILVGEVWLCSGQSNMEFGLSRGRDGEAEVSKADYPQIRLYKVPTIRNTSPQHDIQSSWQVCTPNTAAEFSAVGYFFGRKLHQDLNVPIGLINASWGGTRAEAWTPLDDLCTVAGMQEQMEDRKLGLPVAWKRHGEEMHKFLADRGIHILQNDTARAAIELDDSAWQAMKLPTYWQAAGLSTNGIVWFRKTIEIPARDAAAAADGASLEIGGIDDFDATYVNGTLVGATQADTPSFWSTPRNYQVPAGVLKPGRNVIAIRVVDIGGNGGFTGPASAMKLILAGKAFALDGNWKWQLESEISIPGDAGRPLLPAGDIMATELYNAMIHPYAGYPIAGAIWYQGESNCGAADTYAQLLPTMIQAWRKRWNDQFSFLLVQLANFQADTGKPSESTPWAVFREVQRKIAATVPNTGMATAIDIGEVNDIHPLNKQDVGHRLALQALKLTYGKDLVCLGPTIRSARAKGAEIVLAYDNIGSGLIAKNGAFGNDFAVQDQDGVWAWASARIEGEQVILTCPQIQRPAKVRYAWQNSPPCSLANKEGLPAMPFEVAVA